MDFRDKEKLSVSVKAISALYLSKVAPQEPTNRLSKPVNTTLLIIVCALLFKPDFFKNTLV